MGTYTRLDAITAVYRMLRDTGDTEAEQLLTDDEIGVCIDLALSRYSRVRPATVVEDVTADGTTTMSLPTGWIDETSTIMTIETPTDQDPPAWIDDRYWRVYQTPAGYNLRWAPGWAPGSGDTVRVAYTGTRVLGDVAADTTVVDSDFYPLCALIAAFGADTIAANYARQHEPLLNADSAVRTQAMDWQAIAKRFRDAWERHASSIAAPATGRVNWDLGQSSGGPWLTHGRNR